MCRQPQQKSGSKQPWSNWYDHQTEEAMPLGRLRRQGRQEGGVGLELFVEPNLTQSWRNTSSRKGRGNGYGKPCLGEKERSGPKATNPWTANKRVFLFGCVKLRILSLDRSLVQGKVFQLG